MNILSELSFELLGVSTEHLYAAFDS